MPERTMHRALLRFAAHHPRTVIATAVIMTAAALFCIPRIKLRLDGRSLIPAGAEMLVANDTASAAFALKDIVVVSLVADRGPVLTRDGLERLGRISRELQRTGGVAPHS